MEFKVVENEIIPIYENYLKKQYINARELHQLLNNKRKFSDWIKQRIEQYGFVENTEFLSFSQICEKPQGGRPINEYYITIDMAKELCMVENNIRKKYVQRQKGRSKRKRLQNR